MSAHPPRPVTTYWIDPADHLPGDGITVLVVPKSRQTVIAHRWDGKWFTRSWIPINDVIAWCDLPAPPTP